MGTRNAVSLLITVVAAMSILGCASSPSPTGHKDVQAVDISATSGCQRLGRFEIEIKRNLIGSTSDDAALLAETKAANTIPGADTVAETSRRRTKVSIPSTWQFSYDAYRCLG